MSTYGKQEGNYIVYRNKQGTITSKTWSPVTKKDSIRKQTFSRKAADSAEKSTIEKYAEEGMSIVKGLFD
jgi:hypothetical protein